MVPAELYPRHYAVLRFMRAGILTGQYPETFDHEIRRNFDDMAELLRRGYVQPDEKLGIVESIRVDAFCQQLAQIGHAHTVAMIGMDSYEPLLLPLILGESKRYFELIGGVNADEAINTAATTDFINHRGIYLVGCRIGLPDFGWDFPTYQVICGRFPNRSAMESAATRLKAAADRLQLTEGGLDGLQIDELAAN